MTFGARVTGEQEAIAGLGAYGRAVHAGVQRAALTTGLLLQTVIQANASLPASGPPGPRAITGDYRASWGVEPDLSLGPDQVGAIVGTNKPQARRLEYGFVGADALGRHYNQRPYPHVQPALDAVRPQFQQSMRGAVRT